MGLRFLKKSKPILLILFFFSLPIQLSYSNPFRKPIGFVAEVVGKVHKVGKGKDLKVKSPIFLGDRLETSLSALKAFFTDNSLMYMGPGSNLRIEAYASTKSIGLFRLYKGVVRMTTYHQTASSASIIKTSALDVEYKGSNFLIRVFPYKSFFRTQVLIFRGKVKLSLHNEMGRKPYILREKESMVFYHNGSGRLLRAPMRGVIPGNAFRLLLIPRSDGGKIFLYELASYFKKNSAITSGRFPTSKKPLIQKVKKQSFDEDFMVLSTKDYKIKGGSRKLDPLKASIKEMNRLLEKEEFLNRNRPLD